MKKKIKVLAAISICSVLFICCNRPGGDGDKNVIDSSATISDTLSPAVQDRTGVETLDTLRGVMPPDSTHQR